MGETALVGRLWHYRSDFKAQPALYKMALNDEMAGVTPCANNFAQQFSLHEKAGVTQTFAQHFTCRDGGGDTLLKPEFVKRVTS